MTVIMTTPYTHPQFLCSLSSPSHWSGKTADLVTQIPSASWALYCAHWVCFKFMTANFKEFTRAEQFSSISIVSWLFRCPERHIHTFPLKSSVHLELITLPPLSLNKKLAKKNDLILAAPYLLMPLHPLPSITAAQGTMHCYPGTNLSLLHQSHRSHTFKPVPVIICCLPQQPCPLLPLPTAYKLAAIVLSLKSLWQLPSIAGAESMFRHEHTLQCLASLISGEASVKILKNIWLSSFLLWNNFRYRIE